MKSKGINILLVLCLPFIVWGQSFQLPEGQKSQKIKFEFVNNLMVVPLEINEAKLSFILDSGVSKPILFNISDQDSISINNVTEVTIKGLGGGAPIEALSSSNNNIRIGQVVNKKAELFIVLDKSINLSPSLGVPVHGIIGYDLFKDFVVEVNYRSKFIKFHDPKTYKYKKQPKSETMPLRIVKNKAYIEGSITIGHKDEVPVFLLVDTGSSDSVWLFKNENKGLDVPSKNYEEFLGRGLSGNIFGKRTQVCMVNIGSFELREAKAAFPHMETFSSVKNFGNRNGSIGGEILKRFNIIFDYPNRQITLKKNAFFNSEFQYNLAGIELQHDGMRYIAESIANANGVVKNNDESFGNVQILMENRTRLSLVPEIVVSAIRLGSPADMAGVQEGDLILAINGKSVHHYKLQEVMGMLNEKAGKRIKVLVERYNQDMLLTFELKDIFK